MAYDKPVKRGEETPAPKVPKRCEVYACMTLWNPQAKRCVCGHADVVITLPDGKLIGRCSDHYLRDLYHAKRGVWSDISPSGIPTLAEVSAHIPNPNWAKIGTQAVRTASGPLHVSEALRGAA